MKPLIPYFEPFSIPLPFDLPIVGSRSIYGFGILVAMGFIFGAKMAQAKAERDGLDPDVINRMIGWLVFAVFVGGHLGHAMMYEPQYFLDNPKELINVFSGLSSFGGFFGCAVVSYWFLRRERRTVRIENKRRHEGGEPLLRRVSVLGFYDCLFYGFTLGWFFGRVGCFSAHDHPGNQTDFWLGVYGMCPTQAAGGVDFSVACHDLGLYEAVWALAMVIAFKLLDRVPRYPGFYVGWFITSYAPVRFVMDFFRHPDLDTRYLGLTPAQYGSAAVLGLGIFFLRKYRMAPPIRVARPGEATDGAHG